MLLVNLSGLAGNLHNARLASSVTQRSQINCTHAADDFLKQKTKDSDRSKLGDCQKKRGRLRPDDEPNLSRHSVRLVGLTTNALLDIKLETKKNALMTSMKFFFLLLLAYIIVCVCSSQQTKTKNSTQTIMEIEKFCLINFN
jgi:hypothetical protein